MFKSTNIIDFQKFFRNKNDCLEYLAAIKWPNDVFICFKCGNTNYCIGKQSFSRRCTRCKYDESPTKHTSFERISFDILEAFYVLFLNFNLEAGISCREINRLFSVSPETCCRLRRKLHDRISINNYGKLKGKVLLRVLNLEEPKQRKINKKRKMKYIILGIELKSFGRNGKLHLKLLKKKHPEEVLGFIQSHIGLESTILLPGEKEILSGIPCLEPKYNILMQSDSLNIKSNEGIVKDIKRWIDFKYHHCSKTCFNGYLAEFSYRFNNRNNSEFLFHDIISKMTHGPLVFSECDSGLK